MIWKGTLIKQNLFINTPQACLLQVAWDVSWLSDVLLSWTICMISTETRTWKLMRAQYPFSSTKECLSTSSPITSDFVSSHPFPLLWSPSQSLLLGIVFGPVSLIETDINKISNNPLHKEDLRKKAQAYGNVTTKICIQVRSRHSLLAS